MNSVMPVRSLDKIKELKKYFRGRSDRDYLLFLTGINTGLRISDILQLRVRDVQGTYLAIKEQKTGKRKYIFIKPELRKVFRKYCKDKDNQEYLFKSRSGNNKPIGRSMAYKIMRQAADHCGLEHIGTHTLRKTFGYHLYRQTKDVGMLMELFGHANQGITMRYLGILQDEMDRVMRSFKI